jgi:hypothetical protein
MNPPPPVKVACRWAWFRRARSPGGIERRRPDRTRLSRSLSNGSNGCTTRRCSGASARHAGAATTHSPSQVEQRQGSCPLTTQAVGYEGIGGDQIVAAVRRGIPRIFRDFTTQGGGPGWHHYQVEGLVSLNGGYFPEPRGIRRYRRQALRRCGRAVGLNSWVVFLQFPEALTASVGSAHMFVAKTRRGWLAW